MQTVISEPIGQLLREYTWDQVSKMRSDEFHGLVDRAFAKFDRCQSCGFKIMYNQIPGSKNGPTAMSRSLDYKIIHLIRRSHIRKVLSVLRMSTGKAHYRGDEEQKIEPLTVDTRRFVGNVRESLRVSVLYRFDFRKHAKVLHEVYYEDLLHGSAFNDVLRFIDPKLLAYKATTDIKQNPVLPCSFLVNDYHTIEGELASTKHFHDDPTLARTMRDELQFALADCK